MVWRVIPVRCLSGVLEGARQAGAEVELFSLTEKDVQPCRGCDACHVSGECIIDDDFAEIRGAFERADGLILASPNYIVSVSAQLKAVLDRCAPLVHLQALEGKYGAAVVTSGGPGSDEVRKLSAALPAQSGLRHRRQHRRDGLSVA